MLWIIGICVTLVQKKKSVPNSCCRRSILAPFFFYFIYMGVRVSLRAPQLIPRPTEHPANPVGM